MKFPWKRVDKDLPGAVRGGVSVPRSQVFGFARTASGVYLVAAASHLVVITDEGTVLARRRWVEVDSVVWQSRPGTMTVKWVGSARPEQWQMVGDVKRFADAVQERVTRSVLVAVDLRRDDRELGRAAIRRDPATQELLPQIIWARGIRSGDPEREAYARAVLANLCEQVGIEPPPEPAAEE